LHQFKRELQAGRLGRIEDRGYLDWVKRQQCCGCGAERSDDPHHGYQVGLLKGAGTKLPDYFTLPVCRPCHDALHANVAQWEDLNGSQLMWIALTLLKAIVDGVLRRG
jgi:hypothetical protein